MSHLPSPLCLFTPASETPELKIAIDRFYETWLRQHAIPEGFRLFHYTTLQGMQGILRGRNLRLGHITSFNDPNEVQYGQRLVIEILNKFLRRESDAAIREFLHELLESVSVFGHWVHHAFVVCFCESETLLSQWRAYADQGRGYSLGFRFSSETRIASKLAEVSEGRTPVFRKIIYCPTQQQNVAEGYLRSIIDATRGAVRLGAPDSSIMAMQAANVILDMLLCFKHPAFAEEREWRLFRVTLDSDEPEGVEFREAAGLLAPYRPTYLFDIGLSQTAAFPLRSITFGPGLEPARTRAAIDLFLNQVSRDLNPITLVRSDVEIREPGFNLR